MTERAMETQFPAELKHKHGLSEWWPMLPERSAETITPDGGLPERIYRCQAVGCGEMVRLEAPALGNAGTGS